MSLYIVGISYYRHKFIFLFIIYNSLEVGLWCDNKFLPPKMIRCRFEFKNQPLKKLKLKLKIKSRSAYLDFSQTPQNMGVLCSRYNILTHHVFVGLIWLFHTICSRVKFYIGLDVHAYILGNACCSWYFLRGCNFGRRLTLASLMFWFSSITFRLAIFSVSFFFGGRDMVRHISFINAELLLNLINIISTLLY